MATEWYPSHCACHLALGPDGEPESFITRCDEHQTAAPADIIAENRAMTVARMAVAEKLGIPYEDAPMGFMTSARSARVESDDGTVFAEIVPLTPAQYLDANGKAVSFAIKTG